MTDTSQPLFLFGPGYSAQALASLWSGPVFGTYRSEKSLHALEQTSIEPIAIADSKNIHAAVTGAHLLISIPPDEYGCPARKIVGDAAGRAASITYLSTTGVYGDLGGGWAMEWTPVDPQSQRAKRRVQAELDWQSASEKVRCVRLPGIYGPGRSALDRVRGGKARRIVKDGQVFSRIHVEDLARGLRALIAHESLGAFNLCDDLAAPPQDVIAFAADLIGVAAPPEIQFEDADLSDMGKSFYSECKRVSNARLKAVTGWRPEYPTYREGLSAIRSSEG